MCQQQTTPAYSQVGKNNIFAVKRLPEDVLFCKCQTKHQLVDTVI